MLYGVMDTPVDPPVVAKSNAKEWIVGLILLALFITGFIFGINGYRAETENRSAALSDEASGPDHIEAIVKITGVDAIKGEMTTRIDFVPKGTFTKDDGVTLSRPLKLTTNSANGKQEFSFEAGKRMATVDCLVDLYEGEAADFPFDKHMGELILSFEPGKSGTGKAPAETAKSDPAPATADAAPTPAATPATPAKARAKPLEEDEIPVEVTLNGAVSGLKIEATKDKDDSEVYVDIDMHVSRALTAVAFSYFIMTIQWALTVGVISLTYLVLTGRRKVEFGLLGYFGGLLFAFPALRNSQPGTPPIGTFGDFLSFFWVEVILALCLFAIMMKYLFTPPAK
jgi:hypothetical protein